MALKRTLGKDGINYYFEDGKRISNNYYKLHWYEGGKGRMSNDDFDTFYRSLPDGIDIDTARLLQNNYFQETRGKVEEAMLSDRVDQGAAEEYVSHFTMIPYSEMADKIYIRTEASAGFQQVSEMDAIDIINEKARESNVFQKNTNKITFTKIISDVVDGLEVMWIDYTDQIVRESA